MKYIISIDIGGTTFNAGLFSEKLDLIDITSKDKIRNYKNKKEIIAAIFDQITFLIKSNRIKRDNILCIGVASPGPIDILNGKILDTINLKSFRNYNLTEDFTRRLGVQTFIQNDANLFALGEWFSDYQKSKAFIGVTIGTGFGVGLILNGEIFKGANGMAMEYGISPFKWGVCEDNISIRYLRKRSKKIYTNELSPRIIEEKYFENDSDAVSIYNDFGENLGIAISHIINMIDPDVITIGGGLSNAFKCFSKTMFKSIEKHSPSYLYNKILINASLNKEKSTMLGASIFARNTVRNV